MVVHDLQTDYLARLCEGQVKLVFAAATIAQYTIRPARPRFPRSFYDKDSPIYTMSRFLPPSKVLDAEVNSSILGDGCVVRAGCKINHSVIGLRSLIGAGTTIDDALIMG